MSYVNNVTDTLWADISYFQVPVDNSYLDAGYQVISIRADDGTFQDPNFIANYQWCINAVQNDGRLKLVLVYAYWRVNWQETLNTWQSMITQAGGPHPWCVGMIDLESGGNPGGDQSAGVNSLYAGMVSFLGGDDRRVVGYGNRGDLRTMWQFPGHQLEVILAGYGNNPTSPNPLLTKLAHQYTDGTDFGDALPTGAPPFGKCDMNSADGLSIDALCALVGVGTPAPPATPPVIPTPPPVTVPTQPTSPVDSITLLSAIGDEIFGATPVLATQFGA